MLQKRARTSTRPHARTSTWPHARTFHGHGHSGTTSAGEDPATTISWLPTCVSPEGPLDALAIAAGVARAGQSAHYARVSPSGTALTADQARTVRAMHRRPLWSAKTPTTPQHLRRRPPSAPPDHRPHVPAGRSGLPTGGSLRILTGGSFRLPTIPAERS